MELDLILKNKFFHLVIQNTSNNYHIVLYQLALAEYMLDMLCSHDSKLTQFSDKPIKLVLLSPL